VRFWLLFFFIREISKFNSMISQADIPEWLRLATAGQMSWAELAERLLQIQHPAANRDQPDVDRQRRCGFGEVIFGQHKSIDSIINIASRLLDAGQREVLITRCSIDKVAAVCGSFTYSRVDSLCGSLRVSRQPIAATSNSPTTDPAVMVVTAGSTDLPVAREALETLNWMGISAALLTDVGVAGPFRLLPHLPRLRSACAAVVCAGMEGALASVVGGLVACPVIAVPTSIGYGANLSGVTTLLSMISSCAAGVTVVNIDAGFKGGYVAGLIAAQVRDRSEKLQQFTSDSNSCSNPTFR